MEPSGLALRPGSHAPILCGMSQDDDSDFELFLGPVRARSGGRAGKPLSFERQVMRAVARAGGDPRRIGGAGKGAGAPAKSGRFNARGRGAKIVATFPRDAGWRVDAESGIRSRARRVMVKARVVKLHGRDSQAAAAHLRYLQRDGVTREGERGQLYSPVQDTADGDKFLARSQDDRHQFRLIVAPEDGAAFESLRDFTRRLMDQMEADLATGLDWVAVDHFNTGHPHSHIVVRGVTDDGKILNIAGDYIAHGIRHRASEIMTLELGPQSEWELRQSLAQEMEQDRFTRLDRALLHQAGESHVLTLNDEATLPGGIPQTFLIGRVRKLERMGLATAEAPGRWTLSPELEPTLRELGERGDILKTMQRTLTARGIARASDALTVHRGERLNAPVIGRVVGKGLADDELTDRQHLIVDGLDGRVHYLEVSGSDAETATAGTLVEIGPAEAASRPADRTIAQLAAAEDGIYRPSRHLDLARDTIRVPGGDYEGHVEAHVRRLEALRRAGIVERLDADHWRVPEDFAARALAYDSRRNRSLTVRLLSTLDLDAQRRSDGATWLDRSLISPAVLSIRDSGFGHEVRLALAERRNWLIDQGLARLDGNSLTYRADLITALERRELLRVGREMAAGRKDGLPFRLMEDGERVQGVLRRMVTLASGQYALVENAREFTLVPWRPVIEKELGKTVSGLVRGGGISWEFGRSRGPSIGM